MITSHNVDKSFFQFKYINLPFARFLYNLLPFMRNRVITKKKVLNNFSFVANDHKITWILGKNGAGKTTWINIALGIMSKDNGRIKFDNKSINQVREHISIILDNPRFYDNLDGYNNLRIFAPSIKLSDDSIKIFLARLYLDASLLNQHVGSYSLGQRHRLAVAIAYLRRPKYLFLDEPSIGLDIQSLEAVKSVLKEMKKTATIVLTSHNFSSVIDLIDKIVLLEDGKCSYSGSVDDFIKTYNEDYFQTTNESFKKAIVLEEITKRIYQYDATNKD